MAWTATPESSNIAGFDYDADQQVLIVEFNSGGRYQYYDVPLHVYQGMVAAGSKGQFLAQNVKNIYRYARA